MNLYQQFNQLFAAHPRATAKITGNRGGGVLVAQTPNGTEVILHGSAETGKPSITMWRQKRC
ncbi:hypothetical protein [Suttonella indologenes]|nr:hypothetical protein [Suttonella indologenes]SUO91921.1 Uncharacterised protein [Suttonella indologenes]